jgi:predicted ATPase
LSTYNTHGRNDFEERCAYHTSEQDMWHFVFTEIWLPKILNEHCTLWDFETKLYDSKHTSYGYWSNKPLSTIFKLYCGGQLQITDLAQFMDKFKLYYTMLYQVHLVMSWNITDNFNKWW